MKSSWTPRAEKTFAKIVEYLKEHWNQKEADKFAAQAKKTIEGVEKQPRMYEASEKNKNIRKGFVNKYAKMFYKIRPRKNIIEILMFWHNKQDPKKLKY